MPIDKQKVAEYVAELGLPKEQTDSLIATITGDEKAATQFVGQRLRHSDYTTKTQELAEQRNRLNQEYTTAVADYAGKLTEAESRINAIVRDLETSKISEATANARLMSVKNKYNLSDEDIPALDVKNPAGTGPVPGSAPGGAIDIESRLKTFQQELMSNINRELIQLPRIAALQTDLYNSHRDITGKPLTRAEMDELISESAKQKLPLETVWEKKYNIPDLRFNKRLEEEVAKRLADEEAARRAKASEDALAGVRRHEQSPSQVHSPVIGRQFDQRADNRPAPASGQATQPQTQTQATPVAKPSGAERAAARFIERRNAGIPMGAPDPAA